MVYHGPCPNAEKGFVKDWLHIKGEEFGALLDTYPVPLNQAFQAGQGGTFRGTFFRLLEEFHTAHTGQQVMVDCLITELVINLHRAFIENPLVSGVHAPLAAVRSAIRKNPEKKWNLAQMAEISGYSISRFCQLYVQLYGISPQNDVLQQRLWLAKQLLASGQTSVTYVAQTCGFGSINYFSKYFKKSEGCTPSEYILSMQGIAY